MHTGHKDKCSSPRVNPAYMQTPLPASSHPTPSPSHGTAHQAFVGAFIHAQVAARDLARHAARLCSVEHQAVLTVGAAGWVVTGFAASWAGHTSRAVDHCSIAEARGAGGCVVVACRAPLHLARLAGLADKPEAFVALLARGRGFAGEAFLAVGGATHLAPAGLWVQRRMYALRALQQAIDGQVTHGAAIGALRAPWRGERRRFGRHFGSASTVQQPAIGSRQFAGCHDATPHVYPRPQQHWLQPPFSFTPMCACKPCSTAPQLGAFAWVQLPAASA